MPHTVQTMADRAAFGEDGLPVGVTWIDREAGNPILATLCRLAAEKYA